MEYRVVSQEELEINKKWVYCFCGNKEDSEIVEADYCHIYDYLGKDTMEKAAGRTKIYKLIKAVQFVIKNREEISETLGYLDSIDSMLVLTCYDDLDIAPFMYIAINNLIKNNCTRLLESQMIHEIDHKEMRTIYGLLYSNFICKNLIIKHDYSKI